MLFALWEPTLHRVTRDLDLLGFGNPSPGRLTETFQELCRIEVDPDGVEFDPRTVACEDIRPQDEYAGIRVRLRAHLGKAVLTLQVDVGFGDALSIAPEEITFPVLLAMAPPKLRAYSRETVIAEKLEVSVVGSPARPVRVGSPRAASSVPLSGVGTSGSVRLRRSTSVAFRCRCSGGVPAVVLLRFVLVSRVAAVRLRVAASLRLGAGIASPQGSLRAIILARRCREFRRSHHDSGVTHNSAASSAPPSVFNHSTNNLIYLAGRCRKNSAGLTIGISQK